MKRKIFTVPALFMILFAISSCRGPMGPEGPEGPGGPEFLPISFEFNASLVEADDFEHFQEIPSGIDVLDSDVMLVFVLEDTEDDLEIWRKLPLTEFNSRGTLLFDYDFTLIDVRLFLDANYDLNSDDEFVEVLIRAVHVPANFPANAKSSQSINDVETYEELEQFLGVEIRKIDS